MKNGNYYQLIWTAIILLYSTWIAPSNLYGQEPEEVCPCSACVTEIEAKGLNLSLCNICDGTERVICDYTEEGIPKYCSENPGQPFKVIFGSSRSNHTDLKRDTKKEMVEGLKGYPNATVFLNGWNFDFHHSDHHINDIGVELNDIQFDARSGVLSWEGSLTYADKNYDDEFVWTYWYVVVAYTEGDVKSGTAADSDNGGLAVFETSIPSLPFGSSNETVLPTGWNFDFFSSDHHINTLSTRIVNERADSSTGQTNFGIGLEYADKNSDDDYKWKFNYALFGSPDIIKIPGPTGGINGDCDGGHCTLSDQSATIPRGYENAVVFVRGWKFDLASSDFHINEVGIRLENQEFDPVSRKLTWDVEAQYLDKNGNEDYTWQYWYTIIGFESAQIDEQEYQPPMDQPKKLVLSESMYTNPDSPEDQRNDLDEDGLKDNLEGVLADFFRPCYQFDSAERARRSIEPITAFQARPLGCSGTNCEGITTIKVRWAFLFELDGGYGPAEGTSFWNGGFFTEGGDAHPGDNSTGDIEVSSNDGGLTWYLSKVIKGSNHGHIGWDLGSAFKLEIYDKSHTVFYMSAHKHHEYLNNERDHRDSWYSDVLILDDNNDDVNGNGDFVIANLLSHFGIRYNNVGEPESHPSNFFVNDFLSSEFPDESAWGTDNFYEVGPNIEKWMDHSFNIQ